MSVHTMYIHVCTLYVRVCTCLNCLLSGILACSGTICVELNGHPASDPVPPDQYEVERALSDSNLNVPASLAFAILQS